jgi:peptidoglycan/LPS O-acetylase OafA/YrhL
MPNQAVRAGHGYRPDLDGLRGIAVAAVVAYHLDLPFASGGFVGVDIFFVLSGFLITRLIAAELQAGAFSLTRFYERRIRRIVPALVFVCACTTAVAVVFLLPDELERYASSLIAAAFSVSNIWFFQHSGYFDPGSGTRPLLHTWSLGIEEQFYIVFPLLLMAVFRWWPRALATVIWLLFAVSLAASIMFLSKDPTGTFYLLHARAWELLAGSIVALGLLPRPASRVQSEIAMALGLAAIATAIFAYNTKTPFPGVAALLPCLGTALAVWAGADGRTVGGRLLTVRPLTVLGLISYSLYLWHWPLIVFTKLATSERLTAAEQATIAAAAIILATLTWRFVEQPFRRRAPAGFSRGAIFRGGAFGLGALASVAAGLLALNGMPQRFPESVLQIAAAGADASPLREKCHFHANSVGSYDDTCVIGDDVPPSVIVYGDSHGAEFSAALGELAKSRHASVRQITASGCPPAAGFSFPDQTTCTEYNDGIIERLSSIAPATIVLATYSLAWSREYPDQFWPALERTIAMLRAAGHRVIVLGPVPDLPHAAGIPAAVARWTAAGHDPGNFSFKFGAKEVGAVEAHLNEIATAHGAIFVPVSPELCSEKRCKPYADGTVLYFDNNHLSMSGAQMIASRLLVPLIWSEPAVSGLSANHTAN